MGNSLTGAMVETFLIYRVYQLYVFPLVLLAICEQGIYLFEHRRTKILWITLFLAVWVVIGYASLSRNLFRHFIHPLHSSQAQLWSL
jgi:hypothetical protein